MPVLHMLARAACLGRVHIHTQAAGMLPRLQRTMRMRQLHSRVLTGMMHGESDCSLLCLLVTGPTWEGTGGCM